MKAVKRPIPIEVVEFHPDTVLQLGVIFMGTPNGYRVFNNLHKSYIGVEIGDFLNITNLDDVYPINREVFFNTYDVVEE